jgi:hypothetical protein
MVSTFSALFALLANRLTQRMERFAAQCACTGSGGANSRQLMALLLWPCVDPDYEKCTVHPGAEIWGVRNVEETRATCGKKNSRV